MDCGFTGKVDTEERCGDCELKEKKRKMLCKPCKKKVKDCEDGLECDKCMYWYGTIGSVLGWRSHYTRKLLKTKVCGHGGFAVNISQGSRLA